jgi:hypothetical protein
MIIHHLRRTSLAALAIGGLIASPFAAADPSKEACIEAHSRGQDAREQGKLSLARKLFLACAQASCPALVQGDCARFADDLARLQPTLSFVARDAGGHDLPDTTVYVDDVLVATRLDDGKAHDVDPGGHTVRFSHAGKDQIVTIVVGAGEKGRTVSATFGAPAGGLLVTGARSPGTPLGNPGPRGPAPSPARPAGAKVLVGIGATLALGGGTLGVVGLLRVPRTCSIGTHECAAPPGDPSLEAAGRAITLANIGFVAASVGVAATVGGLLWYVKGAKPSGERNLVAPWLTPDAAGIAVSGRL